MRRHLAAAAPCPSTPPAAVILHGVFQAKRLSLSFHWQKWVFFLCADRTLRRYDGEQLLHTAAITSTTSVAKVGHLGFTVVFPQLDTRYHIRAASPAERDRWVRALAGAVADGPVISINDLYLGRRVCIPLKQLDQVMRPCHLVCTAMFFRVLRLVLPPLPLPSYMQLQFQPLQLQRFLRSCVLATAHALASPPASVCRLVHARKKSNWIDCIFVRVMSGFMARADIRVQRPATLNHACKKAVFLHAHAFFVVQAAATARLAGKASIQHAAQRGDVAAVRDHVIADADCVNRPDWRCN